MAKNPAIIGQAQDRNPAIPSQQAAFPAKLPGERLASREALVRETAGLCFSFWSNYGRDGIEQKEILGQLGEKFGEMGFTESSWRSEFLHRCAYRTYSFSMGAIMEGLDGAWGNAQLLGHIPLILREAFPSPGWRSWKLTNLSAKLGPNNDLELRWGAAGAECLHVLATQDRISLRDKYGTQYSYEMEKLSPEELEKAVAGLDDAAAKTLSESGKWAGKGQLIRKNGDALEAYRHSEGAFKQMCDDLTSIFIWEILGTKAGEESKPLPLQA